MKIVLNQNSPVKLKSDVLLIPSLHMCPISNRAYNLCRSDNIFNKAVMLLSINCQHSNEQGLDTKGHTEKAYYVV